MSRDSSQASTSASIPDYELGDVNESGDVNDQDVRLVNRSLEGKLGENATFNENLADMDRDGDVTRTDFQLLVRKVRGHLESAQIMVSNLSAPAEAEQGETITVSAALTNTGEVGALQNIEYRIAQDYPLPEDFPTETTAVDLTPGETKTVSFEIPTGGFAGDYAHGVFSNNDSTTDQITILFANFAVSNFSAPAEVEQDNVFDATATVTNTGSMEDTQTVTYRFDGEVRRTTNVTLSAGESTNVTFEDIETSGMSGAFVNNVFTEDDGAISFITVLEAFFDVAITDAPDEATPGETINVSATVENTGEATDEQTIEYELGQSEIDVGVIGPGGFAYNVTSPLNQHLSDRYNVTAVGAQSANEVVGEYDVFVVNYISPPPNNDVQAFVEATNGSDTGVVWLENWEDNVDSNGIRMLSDATGDPASRSQSVAGSTPVHYNVTRDHPIFAGVAEAGETVDIHNAIYPHRAWFNDFSGQVIATVGAQNNNEGGPAVGVDSQTRTVLAATFGRTDEVFNSDFTDAADQILANSVKWASNSSSLRSSVAIQQSDTSANVTLAPDETATVEFTYTIPEGTDTSPRWSHFVTSEDDGDQESVEIHVNRSSVEGTVTGPNGTSIEGV